ncbi:MAG: helix-hairpin-helix domain-containing protein [Flavobacteriales bacterium]|jgi:DNA uptake protein ComE-like DNA-binding protein|nr:helix-hairpin-helix domain-containing protein [Flavobacteriales bacterium]
MASPQEREQERQEFASRPFKEQLKDLLHLHKAERRGNAMMMVLLLIAAGAFYYYRLHYKPDASDLEPLRNEMEAWMAARDSARNEPEAAPSETFPFDPNTISVEDWQRLGLSPKQAASIERYRAKGGRFRTKSDVARMYTIKPDVYDRLKPFILLPDSAPKRERYQPRNEWPGRDSARTFPPRQNESREARRAHVKLEVNSADTNALIALPGIGPAFARGITKYRESLGGYHSLDQLSEVYVLKDKPDAVARLKELLAVDTLLIRRIPLNTCTVEDLAAHPYIRWKLAKPIIAYRQHHGRFAEVAAIKGMHLIDEDLYRKLAPYLSVE